MEKESVNPHGDFSEKIDKKLLLMQLKAKYKEQICRLQRLLKSREEKGVSAGYEELRMDFLNSELKMLIKIKSHGLFEIERLEKELHNYDCKHI